jgi:predicted nucleotidyltransferase
LDFREGSASGSRETRDIDAITVVSSWEDFTRLCQRLQQEGFRQGQVAHELWFRDVRIDLIPFSPSLIKNGKLSWPYGDSVMTACGFEEALDCARDQEIAPDTTLPVVSIPGLILTKVVAYMDRPPERARDLIDIIYCFERYEQAAGKSRRFDYTGAKADDEPVTYEEAGAFLLGIEVATLAKPGSLDIVHRFLDGISNEFAPAISQILSEERRLVDSDARRTVLYRLFRVFGAGLN